MVTIQARVSRLPDVPGVYRFRDADGRVLYLGRATNLRQRVRSYWGDLRDRRHLAPMVRRISHVEAVSCASVHEATWLERNLLSDVLPPWNRSRGGEEVPVYIRLGTDLTVVPEARHTTGTNCFGPYLGGQRTRLAVAGLRRVLSLTDVTAVLNRDKASVAFVHDHLLERRDRAAEILAFEFAAQVQRELEALDWITSTQRVTVAGAGTFDVYGWHDGTLVCFHADDGRLRTWDQRATIEAEAREHLAATPPAWRAFAQHNAELAATLSETR